MPCAKLTQPSDKEITYEANTPLKEALDHLSDVYGIRIVIDTALLKLVVQEGEVENAPVKLATLKGPSLSTVLRLLLAQVDPAVAYRIQPDFVEITGVAHLQPMHWSSDNFTEVTGPPKYEAAAMAAFAPRVDADLDKRPLEEALRGRT